MVLNLKKNRTSKSNDEIESREDIVYRSVGTWTKQAQGQRELELGDDNAIPKE